MMLLKIALVQIMMLTSTLKNKSSELLLNIEDTQRLKLEKKNSSIGLNFLNSKKFKSSSTEAISKISDKLLIGLLIAEDLANKLQTISLES